MKLTFNNPLFTLLCHDVSGNTQAHRAGFVRVAPNEWATRDVRVAARLREYADENAKRQFARFLIDVSPWSGPIPHPKDLTPKSFQLDAVTFALSRNRAYLALDPGLGKTIVAALITSALKRAVVYIAPPFLLENVKAEFEKWCPGLTVRVWSSKSCLHGDVVLVPDSLIHRESMREAIQDFAVTNQAILFADEAHRFRSITALRTKALLGKSAIVGNFDRVYFLSGTPLTNGNPLELYPILKRCAPETIAFMDYHNFAVTFCGAYQTEHGWVYSGLKPKIEDVRKVAERVKGTFMHRVRKRDVLPELPPKLEELVLIGDGLTPELADLDREIVKRFSPADLMGHLAPNGHISTYRKELGLLKAREAAAHIENELAAGVESFLVFAIHKGAIAVLADALSKFDPVVIDGNTKTNLRTGIANQFQVSDKRLLIANVEAGGVGLNITKATRVSFVETPWTPTGVDQCTDRAHRIGQTEPVLVQHYVFKNSIDRRVIETNIKKRQLTNLV